MSCVVGPGTSSVLASFYSYPALINRTGRKRLRHRQLITIATNGCPSVPETNRRWLPIFQQFVLATNRTIVLSCTASVPVLAIELRRPPCTTRLLFKRTYPTNFSNCHVAQTIENEHRLAKHKQNKRTRSCAVKLCVRIHAVDVLLTRLHSLSHKASQAWIVPSVAWSMIRWNADGR